MSLMQIVARAVGRVLPVHTALAEMVWGFDKTAQENSDVIKVWLDWSTGFRDDIWPRYLLMQERLYAAVRDVLSRGKGQGMIAPPVNIDAAARLFIGGGHTVALARFAGENQQNIEILIEHLIESIMSLGREAVPAPRPAQFIRN